MGRGNNSMAVLDSRARFIEVERLRVVDASAFTLLPPRHLIAIVYGLAEKVSADIPKTRNS
jgi:choline dehydrogenase